MKGALLVAGTHSDAGKTVIVAGLSRWLARQGVSVAPFKAQNMALNSAVTATGGEIGRAQAVQAAACGIEPTVEMNPILLKPGSDRQSHVIVLGQPLQDADVMEYRRLRPQLREAVLDSLATLRKQHDVVICEGAGSPAEINLRDNDLVNMGLARGAGLPVLVVGDIDRGGVFPSLFGTLALLSAEDQAHVAGFLINKFRGDPALLAPGLESLEKLCGRPTLGVLGWSPGLRLDAEDSLDLDSPRPDMEAPLGTQVLRVAVIRLPRLSNATDVDALSCEPGVAVRLATRPEDLDDADLVVLPGTRATTSDLAWLRERGLDVALAKRAADGRPILGICGGYQMLGASIHDTVEGKVGDVTGLGLLDVTTRFEQSKVLRRAAGIASGVGAGHAVTGYEIRHGRVESRGEALLTDTDGNPEGCVSGNVFGTSWHGLLEGDDYRRSLLTHVAREVGKDWRPGTRSFESVRQGRIDAAADLVAEAIDQQAVLSIIESGVPSGLPFVPPGVLS